MATVAEMKAAILSITGKDLTNQVLLDSATLFCESWGSQWSVNANPFDPETEPTEHAAWPGNATADQLADFMAAKTREFWKSRVWRAKKEAEGAANEAAESAAAQAEADKL